MVSDRHVQLGTVHVLLDPTVRATLDTGPSNWLPLDIPFLTSDLFSTTSNPDGDDVVKILTHLLLDLGLGFCGEYELRGEEVIIRVALLPSDALGSEWRKTKSQPRARGREKWLGRLFRYLRQEWDGAGEQEQAGDGAYVMARTEMDGSRMSNLYAAIPSPPKPSFRNEGTSSSSSNHSLLPTDREVQQCLMRGDDQRGLQTSMYPYQIRSVARMLQMETDPQRLIDPRFTEMREQGRDRKYYVNLSTWDIQRHPGWYDLPKGGILCEQMGVGKTLMCLSLIISTLHQPTRPPPHDIDISPVMTDHMLQTYPYEEVHHLRDRISFPVGQTHLGLPSLVDLCTNVLVQHDLAALHAPLLPNTISPLLRRSTFYFDFPKNLDCMREAKRRLISTASKKIYLANTTLVVVPPILVSQWKQEIEKHVIEGFLNVLVVEKEIPRLEELLQYDIVLMDVERFGMEETSYRMRFDQEPSVLLGARWKRIILDEGHVAGSKTSNAMRLAMALSVERRWAVSGTPTKNLQQGGETAARSAEPSTSRGASFRDDRPLSPVSSAWTRRDLEDASRIGVMIGGFLAAEPFRSDAAFQQCVTSHLRRQGGPPFGAVKRLKDLMDAIMVKHRMNEIDTEASLPASSMTTEVIPFEPMQRLSYNVLASLVVGNVYTSNFEDQDYFLHPKNQKALNQVVANLHLACFWYSAREMDAAGCLERTLHFLKENPDLPEDSHAKLEEAARHLQRALDTPGWFEWMENALSVPCEAGTLPLLVRTAWSDSRDSNPGLVDIESLAAIRNLNKRGAAMERFISAGAAARTSKRIYLIEEERKEAEREAQRQWKARKTEKGTTAQVSAAKQVRTTGLRSPKKVSPTKRKRSEVDANLEEAERNAQQVIDMEDVSDLPYPLPERLETKTRSAKINFVINSVLKSDPVDKFVIFGDITELVHLENALALFDVQMCFVTSLLRMQSRAEALKKFDDPEIKVCLLDTKIAARGLNLVAANRLILLAPMWSLDTQAQAVKASRGLSIIYDERIHRIGQTRPTKIEILVTEGTFEEDIAKRASNARSEKEEQSYSRALIENPRFVHVEAEQTMKFEARFTPKIEPPSSIPTTDPQTTSSALKAFEESNGPDRIDNEEEYTTIKEMLHSPIKRDRDETEPRCERKGKKRVRVAFA